MACACYTNYLLLKGKRLTIDAGKQLLVRRATLLPGTDSATGRSVRLLRYDPTGMCVPRLMPP